MLDRNGITSTSRSRKCQTAPHIEAGKGLPPLVAAPADVRGVDMDILEDLPEDKLRAWGKKEE